MVRAVDVENSVDPYRGPSLQRHSSINAIGTERNFWIAVALEYLSVHFPVAHSAATFAALRIHNDFACELPRSRIKPQSTVLQFEGSANCVEHVAKRETDIGVLRIQLERHVLRWSRNASNCDKCDRSQEWPPHSTSKCLGAFFHPKRSAIPTPA